MLEVSGREWFAFHFYYHQDRDRLLRELILPLATEAGETFGADRFFFVRYVLGGPHIRLRLELPPQTAERQKLEALVAERAAAFFAQHPSSVSWEAEKIAKINQQILASDPNEKDDRVLPDNHWERATFRPEVARYGGAALLDLSYDLFTASSQAAGGLILATADLKESQTLPLKMVLLARLAIALAQNDDELEQLLTYGARWWPGLEPLVAKAEERFTNGNAPYLEIWRRALRPSPESPVLEALVASAQRLRQSLEREGERRELDPASILASHVHMTANRLGLDNANEVYVLALLARAREADLWTDNPAPTPCE